jgi:hypothetical protein
MQKDAALKLERQKSTQRRGLAIGLGLISYACFAKDPVDVRRIFRCEADGRIIFSDQPCVMAPSTEIVLRPSNSYHSDRPAAELSSTRKIAASQGQSTRQSEAIAAEQQRAKQRCQRLADQLVNIENTMRSGYSAKQGEQLRERQRQLEQQRRTEHCR